jgi:hypothetical protein
MAKILIDIFGGEIPKLAEHVLEAKNASMTLDAKVDSGELTAWQDDSKIENLTLADPLTLYQYVQDSGATDDWFYSAEDLDFVNTPQSNDTYERVYFAGAENDQQIDVFDHPNYGYKELRCFPNDLDVAVDWDGDTHYYVLGVIAPDDVPMAIYDQADAAGRGGGSDDFSIVYTYVTQHGEEGPPSSPSVAATMDQADLIKYYIKPPDGLGTDEAQMHEDFNYYVDSVRFYRTSAGVNSTDFLYVGESTLSSMKTIVSFAGGAGPWTTLNVSSYVSGTGVITTTEDWTGFTDGFDETDKWMYVEDQDNGRLYRVTLTAAGSDEITIADSKPSTLSNTIKVYVWEYEDAVTNANLGDVLATTTYVAPPQGLEGITSMANGYIFAWKGNTLYYSVAFLPHAWPVANVISIDQQIVACRGQANTLAIATEGFPYMFSGQSPRTFSKQKMGLFTPCLAKRAVVQIDGGILFPSTDGLYQLTLNGVENVTKKLIRTETWQSYVMSGAFAVFGNNRYFAFPNTAAIRGFMIDFTDGTFQELSPQAECGYRVPDTGLIYYISVDLGTARSIKQWQGDTIALRSYTWKSKKFILPKQLNMAAARLTIDGNFYQELLSLIEDNSYLQTLNATIFADDVHQSAVAVSYASPTVTLTVDQAWELGADIIVNGDFGSDSDWVKGTGWTIAAGVADCSGAQGAETILEPAVDLNLGGNDTDIKYYCLTFTVGNYVAGNMTPYLGDRAGTAVSSNGNKVQYIKVDDTASTNLQFKADADFDADIDDVVLKPVTGPILPGIHRVQDNTTGKDYPISAVNFTGGAGTDTLTLGTVAGGGGEASPPAALNSPIDIIFNKDLEGDINGGDSITVEGRVMASHQIAGDNLFSLNNLNALSTVNLIIWADGNEVFNRNIAGPQAFKLPKGFKATEWQAQISGTIPARRLEIAETMDELSGNRRQQ